MKSVLVKAHVELYMSFTTLGCGGGVLLRKGYPYQEPPLHKM